jgi:hypothetical protein
MFKVHLQGRMGNQLFQYAFAYVTAKKNKTNFLLEMDRNKFYLKPFTLGFPYSLLNNDLLFRIYCQIANRVKMKNAVDLSDCKKLITLPDNCTNTLYKGYFQDASYFHPYKKDLFKLFSLKKKTRQLFEKTYGEIFKQNKTLVICIRTGIDYKNFQLPDYNYPYVYLQEDWFKTIIEKIKNEYQKIVIISDEIKEAKLSNSSYAWWGAYLNTKPNKKIYAPNNWAGYNIGIEYPAGIMTKDFIWVQ